MRPFGIEAAGSNEVNIVADSVPRVLVGVVGAAQGVRGEVRLKSFTESPMAIGTYGPLSAADGRSFTILSCRPLKDDMLVVRFEGVVDRDGAAALTGTRLHLERSRLPPPGEEEFYHVDLIGLEAERDDGSPLGRVVSVENYGAGDLLEIASAAGDTRLIPFTKAFVPTIDFQRRRVVVAASAVEPGEDPVDDAAEER